MSAGTGQDPFLTVAEIAAMTRLSAMTVYRLIHDGDLEAHRLGRSFRIRRAALVAWLEQTPWRPAAAALRSGVTTLIPGTATTPAPAAKAPDGHADDLAAWLPSDSG